MRDPYEDDSLPVYCAAHEREDTLYSDGTGTFVAINSAGKISIVFAPGIDAEEIHFNANYCPRCGKKFANNN